MFIGLDRRRELKIKQRQVKIAHPGANNENVTLRTPSFSAS
jgi:hypothetical protein